DAGDDLRRVAQVPDGVARIDALRGVAQEEVAAALEAAALEDRAQDVQGGARVRRRLKDDHLARAQMLRDRLGRRDDVLQIGRPRLRQRSRDADGQGVELGDDAEVVTGVQTALDGG